MSIYEREQREIGMDRRHEQQREWAIERMRERWLEPDDDEAEEDTDEE